MPDRRPPSDEMCPNPVTCPFVDSTDPHPVSDHPGMPDRRPEKLWVETDQKINESVDGYHAGYRHRPATPADLLAVVRRGVESGTIKGEVVETPSIIQRHWKPGTYIVIGPVSDGGSETDV